MTTTRLIQLDDAPVLAAVLGENRDFLAPWEPVRDDSYFTVEGQTEVILNALDLGAKGTHVPHVILDDSGRLVGRIMLNGIVRGPFQSCSVGYWIAAADNGRGLATGAVRSIIEVAFDELGLHRIQAETLQHNTASKRVLERNNFVPIGMAPTYLKIAGTWQDMDMFQLISPAHQ